MPTGSRVMRERGRRRREHVLRAAPGVIAERGVHATTHRAVAEAAAELSRDRSTAVAQFELYMDDAERAAWDARLAAPAPGPALAPSASR